MRNIKRAKIVGGRIEEENRRGIGRSKAISMSKTRNTTARRKNRREKGIRALL